jgi:hypothetical protein
VDDLAMGQVVVSDVSLRYTRSFVWCLGIERPLAPTSAYQPHGSEGRLTV